MTKKDYVLIADKLRARGIRSNSATADALVSAFIEDNGRFLSERWKAYLDGRVTDNGRSLEAR